MFVIGILIIGECSEPEALAGLECDFQEMDIHLWPNLVGALVLEFAFERIARIDVDDLVAVDVG